MSHQLDITTLPLQGRQLIEASAGTGKTFNITRLYLRLLLERGLTVDQLLVMTFTRAATEELQSRIGLVLRTALLQLEEPRADIDSTLATLLARVPEDIAKTRLRQALLMLDEAAIFTLHGFCRRVLQQQAFASGLPFQVELVTTTETLQLEAIRDIYRRYAHDEAVLPLLQQRWADPESFQQALGPLLNNTLPIDVTTPEQIAERYYQQKQQAADYLTTIAGELHERLINGKPEREAEFAALSAWLEDADLSAMPAPAARVFDGRRFGRGEKATQLKSLTAPLKALKEAANNITKKCQDAAPYPLIKQLLPELQQQASERKRQQRAMTFDDLVNHLADCLRREPEGELCQWLRQQYPVALVDEFQDTDSDQYQILNTIYNDADMALFMIGDPKQAIYGFRGGDVFAYLTAREHASEQWQMDTNWRSSQPMVTAYNRLFWGNELTAPPRDVFDFGIAYPQVNAHHQHSRLHDPLTDHPVQWLTSGEICTAESKKITEKNKRQQIANWCAQEIIRLLSGTVTLDDAPLRSADIAILVRDGSEAADIKQALAAHDLSSVYLSQRDNLFASQETLWLLRALYGILYPEQERHLKAALSTPLFGYHATQLYQLSQQPEQWQHAYERLDRLRHTWQQRGIMAMALQLFQLGVEPPAASHYRSLTNWLHLFELLQQQSRQYRQPIHLVQWLEHQHQHQSAEQEAELRLETDQALLKIVTQHGAKGLEYPVVFIPFASRYKDPLKIGSRNVDSYRYHDDSLQLRLQLGHDPHTAQQAIREQHAETVRLFYVAVTRAEQRCYIGALPMNKAEHSPLGQVLGLEETSELQTAITTLTTAMPAHFNERDTDSAPVDSDLIITDPPAEASQPSEFHGHIERDWWLSSFSALTRNLRKGGLSRPDRDDNSTLLTANTGSTLRFALQRGAAAGNLLHDILERLDFQQPDWYAASHWPLARFGTLPEGYVEEDLHQWLQECLDAPLHSGLRLSTLASAHTLREAEFYFPMHEARMSQLGKLLAQHRQQSLALTLPNRSRLKGMMHGFIDLICEHNGAFYVIDYKSTYLGDHFTDYAAAKLAENIRNNFYDIQYLIYSLALHRYLRHRLPDYDPEQHFGGVLYLYLRGMHPDHNTGVYHPQLTTELLYELDALFAGGDHE